MSIYGMTGSSFRGTIITICLFVSVSGDYKLQEQKDNYIYQASIHLNYNDEFLCGGAVISSHKVLTLGSCLYYNWGGVLPPIIVSVKVAGSDLNTTIFQTDVTHITFHNNFDSSTLQYDLAVIYASKTFHSNQFEIGTIPLATDISSYSYNTCVVTGWNKETKILQTIDAEITDCDTVYDKKLCALPISENSSLCKNSLGSLLVCNEVLLGILSVEPDCNNTNQKLIFEMAKYAADMVDATDTSAIVRQTDNLKLFFGILIFLICLFI